MTKPTTKPKRPKGAGTNGVHPKPKPRRQKRPTHIDTDIPPAPEPAPNQPPQPSRIPETFVPPNANGTIGRRASTIRPRAVSWLLDPYIARETLHCVAGEPDSGKSCFGAWLVAQAARPCILPGREESVELRLLPRLIAAGADLDRVTILDDRDYMVPDHTQSLIDALRLLNSDLLWIDPIDTYINEDIRAGGEDVRTALESLAKVATATGAAVVYVRHPGKQPGNWCPGVRHWRAVPRVILLLVAGQGVPRRQYIRAWRDLDGSARSPREYVLRGEPGEPPQWALGPEITHDEAAIMEVTDSLERRAIDRACTLLEAVLASGEQEVRIVRRCAEDEGITERTLQRAVQRLNVQLRRQGQGREHKAFYARPLTPDT